MEPVKQKYTKTIGIPPGILHNSHQVITASAYIDYLQHLGVTIIINCQRWNYFVYKMCLVFHISKVDALNNNNERTAIASDHCAHKVKKQNI